ncbi:hypothetical protein [Nocardia sp. NPDC052566]|uniref:DUF7373 family lipoprotein n=1 Tax=Nocardia sp. NPDC052566 TaxID=3364330 RepID=UPI0037CA4259
MRVSLRAAVVGAVGLVLLGALAGCGESAGAVGDYGSYSPERADGHYDDRPSRSRGRLVESLRLGEHVVLGGELDAELSVGRGGGVLIDESGKVNDLLSGPQQAVLERYQVVAGFSALAANKPYSVAAQPQKFLSVALIAFPDEQTAAAAAARDMENADFTVNPDNVPVAVEAYPASISHWRPGVATLGSWLTWKSLVIRVLAELPEADLAKLTDVVARTYQRQLAQLEAYRPTPPSELPTLTMDPDRLLPRLVKTGDYTPSGREFAVYGAHAFAAGMRSPAADFDAGKAQGLRSVGIAHNKNIYRLRDAAAASAYAAYLAGPRAGAEYRPIRGVSGLPSVTCSQAAQPSAQTLKASRFRCFVVRDELVAEVFSNEEIDVRRLAAAQYAVMGDERR